MEHTVIAKTRTDKGSGSVRRLRKQGLVPGIVYGQGEPKMISVDGHKLQLDLTRHEGFYSSVLNVEIDGNSTSALLREVQSHPITGLITHVDFQSVAENVEISATIPIHFIGAENSPGVKLNHGIFSSTENEIHVHCLPKNLPEFIEVDVSTLDLNQSVHLDEISAPAGVKFDALVRGENPALAAVLPPQKEEEVVTEEATTEEGEVSEATEEDAPSE